MTNAAASLIAAHLLMRASWMQLFDAKLTIELVRQAREYLFNVNCKPQVHKHPREESRGD